MAAGLRDGADCLAMEVERWIKFLNHGMMGVLLINQ